MRGRDGRVTTVETRVHGFRLIVVMETHTRIPVAAKLVQIQENGNAQWQELINQARANLAEYATVETIVADREFVDGEIMWWVQEQGMGFVIPGKNRMDVVKEARQRMRQACASTGTADVARGGGAGAAARKAQRRMRTLRARGCQREGKRGHGAKLPRAGAERQKGAAVAPRKRALRRRGGEAAASGVCGSVLTRCL